MTRMIGLLLCAASALSNGACSGDTDTSAIDAGNNADALCVSYCIAVMTNCIGSNKLYPDSESCLATCAAIPGDEIETSGNTVKCRTYHAGIAGLMDATDHCGHASASGGGVCGTKCEAYCSQIQTNCTGVDASFADRKSCIAACAAMPEGLPSDTTGNTVECRTYHASFPAAADSTLHCPHSGTSSDNDICGGLCDAYCDQVMANCSGANELYIDRATCISTCRTFTPGAFDDQSGDTTQCRIYHASFPALADGAMHCPHAGIDGAGVCVTP